MQTRYTVMTVQVAIVERLFPEETLQPEEPAAAPVVPEAPALDPSS